MLQGRAGNAVKSSGNTKLELKIRTLTVEVWVGPDSSGGMKVNSIYPTGTPSLSTDQVIAFADDVLAGTKTAEQVRSEIMLTLFGG